MSSRANDRDDNSKPSVVVAPKAPPKRRAGLRVAERKAIELLVAHYEANRGAVVHAAESIVSMCRNDTQLNACIHFIKYRTKDPGHLREKLSRQVLAGRTLPDKDELFDVIRDLAGVRILHLYGEQMRVIHSRVVDLVTSLSYEMPEPPVANCWDVESEKFFAGLGLKVSSRDSMYTSVHYIIRFRSTSKLCCELQVRTLAEELWGEVSHRVDYPSPTSSVACKEQLRALARVTSGCTRLVDSIFRSRTEFDELSQ